ncbi:hypothetical protein [Streptomyces decoyicus]
MFATTEDVAARLGRPLTDDELPRVGAFLLDASTLVAEYCTRPWSPDSPPAVFKLVVCAEVIRWLSITPGVSRDKVGELETEYTGASSVQFLSGIAKDNLSRYRRQLSSIPLTTQPPCPPEEAP